MPMKVFIGSTIWKDPKDVQIYEAGAWRQVKRIWTYVRTNVSEPATYEWKTCLWVTPPAPGASESCSVGYSGSVDPIEVQGLVSNYIAADNEYLRRRWQLRHGSAAADGGLYAEETLGPNSTESSWYTGLPAGTYYFRTAYIGDLGHIGTWLSSSSFTA